MSLSTTEAVREVFRLATQQALTRALRTPEDWQAFTTIAKEADARIRGETGAFKRDYGARLAEARQVILREGSGRILDIPKPRDTADVPDKARLDQRADTRVRHDHTRRLAAIRTDEIDAYQNLRETVRSRDARQGQAKTEFNRAQARSGPSQAY